MNSFGSNITPIAETYSQDFSLIKKQLATRQSLLISRNATRQRSSLIDLAATSTDQGIRLFQLEEMPRSWPEFARILTKEPRVNSNRKIRIGVEQQGSRRVSSLCEWVHLDFLGV